MNSRRKQIIKVGIIVLIVVLLGMMLTHCTNTAETKSVKLDKTVEESMKKVNAKKTGKNKSIDVDKSSSQEEKKEETAKTDSSNKSNTSESKKDNTTSTTNTSLNKNNTSSSKPSNSSSNNSNSSKPSNNSGSNSSSSKPAEHKHDWVAQYKTVNIPEKGHNEQVLVQAAYDEQVPITEMKAYSICNQCGVDITGFAVAHNDQHLSNYEPGGYHTEWRETVTGYNTVHHDAVYETRYVVDSPATTKQELTGYKCSGCGKTRSN
ncbi:hypothetical protein [uncultured Holdemanella sp.]|uniref:hypothetical protein n=1 Tax=uncultured Holdemanella sp. TaxID=1763549 RepID=UPI0025E82176|nr:hypothetical protein [uncultured Holdemanella sp.]